MKNKSKIKIAGPGKAYKEGGFIEALHSLPYKMVPDATKDICGLCYWSIATYRLKLRGKVPFRFYEIEQIEKYFTAHNLNAWTGEKLN